MRSREPRYKIVEDPQPSTVYSRLYFFFFTVGHPQPRVCIPPKHVSRFHRDRHWRPPPLAFSRFLLAPKSNLALHANNLLIIMSDDRVKRTQEITRLRVSRFQKLRKGAAGDRLHECELSIRDEVIENDEEGINKYFN